MASRWWSASMLLASLMSLYWMTSAAQPPVTLAPGSRETAQVSTQMAKDALTVINEIFQLEKVQKASAIIRSLSKCASLVPGIGGLVSSVISFALAFIPQDDPVLNTVKEINRKLDSLSIQISDLATDVQWFNYISTYSQDERNIVNAWMKFNEFPNKRNLLQSETDKQRLKRRFIRYLENTGAENSMNNLYHYLTVTQTSMSENINELMKDKFKCDVGKIGKYNLFLNSLLWKGMVVNQFYWKLMGFNTTVEEAKHSQMFKNVTKAQISTIEFCLDNYEDYMKEDVIEITKALSPRDKETIAAQVKKSLDKKYNWYNWVVLVYDNSNDDKMLLYNMTKIPVGDIIVAVDYTLEGWRVEEWDDDIKVLTNLCYYGENCKSLEILPGCTRCFPIENSDECRRMTFGDFGKLVYVAYNEYYEVQPKSFYINLCRWGMSYSNLFIYYSGTLSVCIDNKCKNGNCVRLLNSNESWCKCRDGYYGDTCEEKMMF